MLKGPIVEQYKFLNDLCYAAGWEFIFKMQSFVRSTSCTFNFQYFDIKCTFQSAISIFLFQHFCYCEMQMHHMNTIYIFHYDNLLCHIKICRNITKTEDEHKEKRNISKSFTFADTSFKFQYVSVQVWIDFMHITWIFSDQPSRHSATAANSLPSQRGKYISSGKPSLNS